MRMTCFGSTFILRVYYLPVQEFIFLGIELFIFLCYCDEILQVYLATNRFRYYEHVRDPVDWTIVSDILSLVPVFAL
jgi:hypothetical protein